MLDFLSMTGTHDSRAVDNTEINEATIDTCLVTDSNQPYETGISHKSFDKGNWIIVEQYDTKEEAQKGHDKWVELFTKEIPKTLKNVSNCEIIQIGKLFNIDLNKEHEATLDI